MDDFLKVLIVSGSLGALIGLERQWNEQATHPEHRIPAGLRTFTLLALIGAISAHLAGEIHGLVFPAALLGIMAFMAVYLYFRTKTPELGTGLTTAAVGVLTFLLGGLVYLDFTRVAVVLTVTVIILLAGKRRVHEASKRFTSEDVRLALQFGAVTGIVLPLVPDQAMGPLDAFNPRSTWLMVVIVSSVGFLGYVAVRVFGTKLGIPLTGLAGGLASSTATTLAMSRSSKVQPWLSPEYASAIILACTIMFWRVAFILALINPPLAATLFLPLAVMSLPGVLGGALSLWRARGGPTDVDLSTYKNPLGLRTAIQFALLYAVIVFVIKLASGQVGDGGIYLISFLSGLTDLDAIALSLSKAMQQASVPTEVATAGILIGAAANTLLKAILAASLGSPALRWRVTSILGLMIALGGIMVWWMMASSAGE